VSHAAPAIAAAVRRATANPPDQVMFFVLCTMKTAPQNVSV
jgi:hypothetical protein